MAVNKLDPKVIFASTAPTQDTPAVFPNKTNGWGESRKNGGRPTIKQMNALQQETDLKILWLNENAVTPYDLTIDYPNGSVTIKDGTFKILDTGVWKDFVSRDVVSKLKTIPTYYTVSEGVDTVTGVGNGAYYNVRSSSDESYVDEYQNVGGVATPTGKSYPSSAALNNIPHNNLKDRDVDNAHPTSAILDDSGENQQEINNNIRLRTRLRVSAEEFGIVANSNEDQTARMDVFTNFLRENKVKGILPAGRIIVDCNKTKTFGVIGEVNYREEKYAVDISGCDIEGVVAGYRNATGTIIKCLEQDGTALMQAQTSASFITHNIKGIKVENANLTLRWTYSVGSTLENFYFDNTCVNGMALGDATLAMPLLNRFKSINGECQERPLITDGNGGCNLNYFEELYLIGNLPSKITATGGYGAVSNLFVSCEFASRATGTAGLDLGRTRSTTLINPYYEAHKNCIKITESTTALKLINPVLSGMKEYDVKPAFILHDTAAVCDVSIDGGTVFANEINDTRLIDSVDPTKLYVNIIKNPQVVTNKTGYRVMEFNTFKTLAGFTGFYEDSFTPTWSASGATPSGFTTAQGNISVQGKVATVSFNFVLSGAMTLPTGNYYPELPRTVKSGAPAIGAARVRRENAADGRTEVIAQSFADSSFLQILLQQISATYNDTTKTVAIKNTSASISNTTLTGYENGSFVKASLNYIIA